MTKVYHKYRQKVGVYGEKVIYLKIVDKINNKFMHYYGKRIHKVREVASLTKIVTSMTTIDYLSKYDLDPSRVTYQIRKPSVMIGGTTAGLQIG